MNKDEYISTRLDDQIAWYEKESNWNQKCYKIMRSVEIVVAAFIPIFTFYITSSNPNMKIFVGALAVIVVIVSSLLALFKFQEHWLQYRTTAESLKHHKFLYLTKTSPYDKDNAFTLFVSSTEGLISKENSNWSSFVKEKAK